jgi:hypothetical protein
MPRRTRKALVGKIENSEVVQRLRELGVLERLLKREFWSQQRGQVSASAVLPLCPHAQRERDRARREFRTMDPFEHKEE